MKKKGDNRAISRDELERRRFKAIELRDNGWKIKDIAESFGFHPDSVSRWFVKLNRYGKKSLKSSKPKGSDSKLSEDDKKKITEWLKKSAMDFGFETPLWTCKNVKYLIKKRLGISIHRSNVWEWLRKWGLTNQKPQRRAIQRDERVVNRWLREEWPKIKEHRRRWQAMLYFQDESGVSLIAVMGKTWAPKGQTPVVRTTGKRGGLCVTSAISPAGRMPFRIEKGKINAEKVLDEIEKLPLSTTLTLMI